MRNKSQVIADEFDLRTPEGMVAILLTIRNARKITYPQLYEKIFGELIEEGSRDFRTTKLSMRQIFAFHTSLLELYRNGFIETTTPVDENDVLRVFQSVNPANNDVAIELQASSSLSFTQYLFNISLSQIVEKGRPLPVYPAFGDPNPKGNRYSDVFVIMPFREELDEVYNAALKPAVEACDMTVNRGDEFFSDERIMDEVWAAIYKSKLCIADCTGQNPNVFYELGIAHTLGKPTILLTHHLEEIPFDIRDRRIIIYEDGDEGLATLCATLEKTILAEMIEHYGDRTNN